MTTCPHLDQMREVTPRSNGCEDCLRIGDTWLVDHLRRRGLSHEHAQRYHEQVAQGRRLVSVTVTTDAEDEEARSLMVDIGADEISSAADGTMHVVHRAPPPGAVPPNGSWALLMMGLDASVPRISGHAPAMMGRRLGAPNTPLWGVPNMLSSTSGATRATGTTKSAQEPPQRLSTRDVDTSSDGDNVEGATEWRQRPWANQRAWPQATARAVARRRGT